MHNPSGTKGHISLIYDVSRLLAWASAPGHRMHIVQHLPRLSTIPAVQCASACLITQFPIALTFCPSA